MSRPRFRFGAAVFAACTAWATLGPLGCGRTPISAGAFSSGTGGEDSAQSGGGIIQSGGEAAINGGSGGNPYDRAGAGGHPARGGFQDGGVAQGGGPTGGRVGSGGITSSGGRISTGGHFATGGHATTGGAPPTGGVPSSGGRPNVGGVLVTAGSPGVGAGGAGVGDCCQAHSAPGCSRGNVESCVCGMDIWCCLHSWDAVCVEQVTASGCGQCGAVGSGGHGNAGAAGAPGFASSGTAAAGSGGTPPPGGASGRFSMAGSAGSVAAGRSSGGTGYSGLAGGGGTMLSTGGTLNGGMPASGGATPTGGMSANGGADPRLSMIDDMEDGTGDIPTRDGRLGYWYAFNDRTSGWQLPVSNSVMFEMTHIGDRPGSQYAAWTSGGGFTDWGAGMGVFLDLRPSHHRFYDASKYLGISFWAKRDVGDDIVNALQVTVSDHHTVASGGYCTVCGDDFGTTIVLSTEWRHYSFVWTQLKQTGWGDPQLPAIDPTALRDIEFTTQADVNFGFYIDDLAFLE